MLVERRNSASSQNSCSALDLMDVVPDLSWKRMRNSELTVAAVGLGGHCMLSLRDWKQVVEGTER